jgi:hypothetical protein
VSDPNVPGIVEVYDGSGGTQPRAKLEPGDKVTLPVETSTNQAQDIECGTNVDLNIEVKLPNNDVWELCLRCTGCPEFQGN